MSTPATRNHQRLRRFLTSLWVVVLIIVMQVPWPYAAAATLLAICLHFAALDGPLAADAGPQGKSRDASRSEHGAD